MVGKKMENAGCLSALPLKRDVSLRLFLMRQTYDYRIFDLGGEGLSRPRPKSKWAPLTGPPPRWPGGDPDPKIQTKCQCRLRNQCDEGVRN